MQATQEFLQSQIDELKAQLKGHTNCDYWKSENGRVQGQIISLINHSYENDTDSADILTELCQIIDYEPKKTVRITATINVELEYDIPLDEVEGFDAHYFISDNISIDSSHGDVLIQSWDVEDHDVDWN